MIGTDTLEAPASSWCCYYMLYSGTRAGLLCIPPAPSPRPLEAPALNISLKK